MKVKQIRWNPTIDGGAKASLAYGVTADIVQNFKDTVHYKLFTGDTYIEGTCDTMEEAKARVQGLWKILIMEAWEENKGCEYCLKDTKSLIDEAGEDKGLKSFLETRIDGNSLCTYADIRSEYQEGEKKINYCPMCGRRLEVK